MYRAESFRTTRFGTAGSSVTTARSSRDTAQDSKSEALTLLARG